MAGGAGDPGQTAEQALRRSYGKLVALLAARTRDVATAEDALADAFAAAMADWPRKGAPDNPEAWLLTVARRKLVDAARRRRTSDAAAPYIQHLADELAAEPMTEIPDQRLALMFACAHPAIDAGVRTPLILQTILGLSAEAIASAFLITPESMAKRLVRAKDKIRKAGIPFAIPERADLPARLEAVLDAVYAAYSQGWGDAATPNVQRQGLAAEALFLVRTTAQLLPEAPEALGLAALVCHAEARRPARRGVDGEFIPLAEQDVGLWDPALIAEAEVYLWRAGRMAQPGRFQIEAAIQSAHVHRLRTGARNWSEIVGFYDLLVVMTRSPVAAINRAMALAEAEDPEAGLAAMPDAADDKSLAGYQPYWAARADLLARVGHAADAHHAYEQAIVLESDPAVKRFLGRRQAALRN